MNAKPARVSPKERILKQFAALTRRYEKLIDEIEGFPPETQKRFAELKFTSIAHLTEAYGLSAGQRGPRSGNC
jgi:hypothetical protein